MLCVVLSCLVALLITVVVLVVLLMLCVVLVVGCEESSDDDWLRLWVLVEWLSLLCVLIVCCLVEV